MKTVTEFSGFFLRGALKIRQDLFQKKKLESKDKEKERKEEEAKEVAPSSEENTQVVDVASAEHSEQSEQNQSEQNQSEQSETTSEAVEASIESPEAPVVEAVEAAESVENVEAAPSSEPPVVAAGAQKNPKQKPKNWVEVSDDELKAALAEGLKIEGEKLEYILNAIKAVDRKREEDLKRVVVSTLDEGEKQPDTGRLLGAHFYTVEYLPSLRPVVNKDKKFNKRFDKNGKGKRGGKGRSFGRGQGRDGEGGGGGRRPPRGAPRGSERGENGRAPENAGERSAGGEERKNFRPRKPFVKKPRVQIEPQPPGTVLIKI